MGFADNYRGMSQKAPPKRSYTVREFRDADRDDYLELHSRVFEPNHGVAWFKWKYEDNPYLDHVPIIVAEKDGELVGARSHFALDMSITGSRQLSLQPADTMVHPEHRRQGLFTQMTEAAIEKYSHGPPTFFFNFPNHRSGKGNLKLGWELIDEHPTYYRVQRPVALGLQRLDVEDRVHFPFSNAIPEGYNRLSNARLEPDDGVTVNKYESIPSATLAALATERSTNGICVFRDQQFYKWRFENPSWTYDTYLAERDGEAIAGVVVGTSVTSKQTVTKLVDIVPLPGTSPNEGLEALLARVLTEYSDSDVMVAPATLPDSVARKAGFLSDDRPPLSYVATQTIHVVRSLTDSWTPQGVDITDSRNWQLTFSAHDTS